MNWLKLEQASLDDIVVWAEAQSWCRAMADCAQDGVHQFDGDHCSVATQCKNDTDDDNNDVHDCARMGCFESEHIVARFPVR